MCHVLELLHSFLAFLRWACRWVTWSIDSSPSAADSAVPFFLIIYALAVLLLMMGLLIRYVLVNESLQEQCVDFYFYRFRRSGSALSFAFV